MDTHQTQRLTRFYFTLPVIEGVGLLATGMAGTGSSLLSGLIFLTIPFILLFIATLLLFIWLAWTAWRHPARMESWVQKAGEFLSREPVYWSLVALTGLGSAAGLYFLPISLDIPNSFIEICIAHLLTPYLLWFLLLAVQTLVAVRVLRYGFSLSVFIVERNLFRTFAIVIAVSLLLILTIGLTGIGLNPDPVDWGVPGVPLLASQVVLSVAVSLIFVAVLKLVIHLGKKVFPHKTLVGSGFFTDALICLLLWAGAVWLWNAQPLQASWFNPRPRPPTQEYYPYSDSIHYDMSAQRLLLGKGFEADVIRPVYSGFLALAQAASGIRYESVITWQVLVLALIPPLLFLLGSTLHHRLSGILVGLLAVIHETNSLALAGQIDVSNSKMYMSDLPAQLGIIIFCIFVAAWLKAPLQKKLYPFLAGGFLGIFFLVRTQIVLILPVLPLLGWLAFRRRPARWLQGSLLLIAGLLITLAPWSIRNWTTARSLLSDPEPGGVIYRFDTFAPEAANPLPGETVEDYNARKSSAIVNNMLARPRETFEVITGHYVNNHIASLFVLPTSFPVPLLFGGSSYNPCSGLFWLSFWEQCCSVTSYVSSVPYWSGEWEMDFPPAVRLPLAAAFLLLSLGIAASWERARLASLAPLLIAFLYNWGNAGARLSGWRFNLPVDWVGMLFFAIGLVQVLFWIGMTFGNRQVPGSRPVESNLHPGALEGEKPFPWRQTVLAGAFFFLFTTTLPVAERLIQDPYQGKTAESALDTLQQKGLLEVAGLDRKTVDRFLAEEGAAAYIGRALYPRHYPAKRGEPSVRWPVYLIRDYPRLGFMLAPDKVQVILPLGKPPAHFPNTVDVLVLGCQRDEFTQAYLVAILDEPETVILSSNLNQWSCAAP